MISATGTDPERHWLHPVPTLEICLRGVVRLNRGRRQPIDLHPGDAAVVAPGAVHEHAPLRRGAAALGLGFDYGVCDLALMEADISIPAFLPQQLALQLVNRLLRNDASALPAVLALVLEHHLQEARPLPQAVVRMRDRIRTHGLTPITAADLARISGLGTSRAWEIFHHHLGCTPRQALERRRCAVAAAMLTQGMSVASVATRCGFADRGTFTRAFTRIHGKNPSAWQQPDH